MADIGGSSRVKTPKLEEEIVVGFENEAMMIKEQLTGGKSRREVISIIGMAGLGKTTLARKLYNDLLIVYHFHIRAWTYVSQVYQKRDLLLGILSSVMELTDEMYEMSDEKLSEKLKRGLMGRRYLIVMDDIWSVEAWDCLDRSFPDNNNGSRIMFTSRLKDVALHAQPGSHPHCLRFLSEHESWDLFQLKAFGKERFQPKAFGKERYPLGVFSDYESWDLFQLKLFGKERCPPELVAIGKQITIKCLGLPFQPKPFGKEGCPPELVAIGKHITIKCKGLPLAIVVTAGLLAKIERTKVSWERVANNVSSQILTDPKQFMDTLALSYNHLPHHLKACFLYLGLLQEGGQIPVRKLIWSWVAGGFIKQIGQKCLEDVAEDYLMDLIGRSLVIVAKKGSNGRIRTCRIHDLLLDLCLRKAEEENFMKQFYKYSNSSPTFSHVYSMPSAPHVHSLLCFGVEWYIGQRNTHFICPAFLHLRVLDLSSFLLDFFPSKIVDLVHLRYLALRARDGNLPALISKLRNLETFFVSSGRNITLPQYLWKIVTLRHLYIESGMNVIEYPCFEDAPTGDGYPSVLAHLQTISQVCPSRSCQAVLARTPILRELGFCGPLISKSGDLTFPDLSDKNHLETLKLLNTSTVICGTTSSLCDLIKFPEKLKRLTLSGTNLKWSEMWILGILPNLEVLKLKFHACVGPQWETCDGGFGRLKFLKFEDLDIVRWNASINHFPALQRLVLQSCGKLEGIPLDLGDISTLEIIELNWCSQSATESARLIRQEQEKMGNDLLKIHIKFFPVKKSFNRTPVLFGPELSLTD